MRQENLSRGGRVDRSHYKKEGPAKWQARHLLHESVQTLQANRGKPSGGRLAPGQFRSRREGRRADRAQDERAAATQPRVKSSRHVAPEGLMTTPAATKRV